MSVLYGLDASTPPTLAQAQRFYQLGYRFFCGYIYGNTPYKWSRSDIHIVTDAGMLFVPIGVALISNTLTYRDGVNDGNDMLQAMQERGLSGLGTVDYENGIEPVDHGQGFNDAMHAGQASTMIYGLDSTLVALAGPWDLYWLAHWMSFQNGVPRAPTDWDMWQVEDGSPCDFNACRADFPFGSVA